MRVCEVCGAELKYQKRFCSPECKALAQTKEWEIARELRKMGRVSFSQLTLIVANRLGKRNADERLSRIISLLKLTGRVEIVVRGRGDEPENSFSKISARTSRVLEDFSNLEEVVR